MFTSDTIATSATKTYNINGIKSGMLILSRGEANFQNTYAIDSWKKLQAISEISATGTTISITGDTLSVKNNLAVAIQLTLIMII
jgi:bifunctional pyridoxal-dependent enzyme with beta-cystathionase and maltose regulon repressor activities